MKFWKVANACMQSLQRPLWSEGDDARAFTFVWRAAQPLPAALRQQPAAADCILSKVLGIPQSLPCISGFPCWKILGQLTQWIIFLKSTLMERPFGSKHIGFSLFEKNVLFLTLMFYSVSGRIRCKWRALKIKQWTQWFPHHGSRDLWLHRLFLS